MFRVMENNNFMFQGHPLQSLFIVKIVLDYFMGSVVHTALQIRWYGLKIGFKWFKERCKNCIIEFALLYCISLGDREFYFNFNTNLDIFF